MNTDKDVLKVGDLYYLCFQGVWFMSRAANGPWEVTGSVPKEIYEIPVSSPSHNVTYVTVVEDNNDAVVYATAARTPGSWSRGAAPCGDRAITIRRMSGTAAAIRFTTPSTRLTATAPGTTPGPGTYGRGAAVYGPYGGAGVTARYNPYTGTYARGAAAWGPYGGVAGGSAYNARTGTYARGGVAAGPYGARGAAEAYNPRTGTYGATRQGAGVYGSWGQTGVQRGDQWATSSRVTNNVTGATTRRTETSGGGDVVSRRGGAGGNSFAGSSGSGDVYAGQRQRLP